MTLEDYFHTGYKIQNWMATVSIRNQLIKKKVGPFPVKGELFLKS